MQTHKNSYVTIFTAQQGTADVSINIQLVTNITVPLYFESVRYELEKALNCNVFIFHMMKCSLYALNLRVCVC